MWVRIIERRLALCWRRCSACLARFFDCFVLAKAESPGEIVFCARGSPPRKAAHFPDFSAACQRVGAPGGWPGAGRRRYHARHAARHNNQGVPMSRSLIRSTSLVGGFTLVSRVLGLLRDMAFAAFLAVGPAMDAFFVAFKIPNFMRRMFGEGAFSQAFVPVVSEYRQTRPHEEVKALVERVAGTFGALLLLINVIGLLAAPLLVMLFAPGFLNNPGQVELTTELLRVTFPYLFFIALTAFAGGVLNTYGRFGAPALAPVLLNIALISAAAWGSRWFETSVMALAWAVFAAGIAQLLLQLPSMAKLGLFPWPRFDRSEEHTS